MAALRPDDTAAPIGKPVPDSRAYVLDDDLRLCPVGVIGELYIAGAGLSRGYWNRPGLTAERFVANPYAQQPGERLYRTGDLAAWRDDGSLLFHGRADRQLKLRGFRIEPGEIEAALLERPEIGQASVIAREDPAGEPRLVAYLVPAAPQTRINTEGLRESLTQRLPAYMIPAAFVQLDSLPQTANNKLDSRALLAIEDAGVTTTFVALTTPEEILLCELVAKLLGLKRVGLADHFFHLGGHSLLAVRLAAQVRHRLGRELPVHAVFDHPVLGELARCIGLAAGTTAAFDILLPLRREGLLPPLFCLHPGSGLCWPYASLLQRVDPEQPVYGIQARGFADDRTLPMTLGEIVADSLAVIRRVQLSGPYRLAGWSFGGIVAHLIATQLQTAGEQVEQLLLFDSYPATGGTAPERTTAPGVDETWREIALGTNLAVTADPSVALDAGRIQSLAREQSHLLGSFTIQHLERLAAVMANNARLVPTATLDRFSGDLTLFVAARPTPGLDRTGARPEAWQPFCTGAIIVREIAAEHHQMLSPEAVIQMHHDWLQARSSAP